VLAAVLLIRIHVRATWVYVALGVMLWLALHEASVSPALAGVVIGFLTPATPFQRPAAVSAEARRVADRTVDDPVPPDADAPEWLWLADLSRDAVPPLARAERAVLPIATWIALPLFALANAGVEIPAHLGDALREPVVTGMLVARVIGKPFGIALGVALALRLGVARRSPSLSWPVVFAVGSAASIPFAVSLFVVGTAAEGQRPAEIGAFAVVVSAFVAAVVGLVAVRRTLGHRRRA
jgi:NhaA family Na+:H+ antiporter